MPQSRPRRPAPPACIGVCGTADLPSVEATLTSLGRHTLACADVAVLAEDGADALRRLAAVSASPVLVTLEAGCLVGPGWLENLLAALAADPRNGVARPSTGGSGEGAGIAAAAVAAAERAERRFGSSWRVVSPEEGAADVCRAARREAIGTPLAGTGFRDVWARGAFVAAPPERAGTRARARTRAPTALQTQLPLVTCVMPTRNRLEFALQAVRCFQRQDYPARELVIVDDGEDRLGARLPGDARIRYVRAPAGETVGAKRNRACELARGAVVAHWDDDDWHGPGRLRAQVEPLLAGEADVTGLSSTVVLDLHRWEFWASTAEAHGRLFLHGVHGGTLVYARRVWQHLARFPNRSLAEDAAFLARATRRGCRLAGVPGDDLFVYVRHDGNTWSPPWRANLGRTGWQAIDEPSSLRADRGFYTGRSPAAPTRRRVRPARAPLVSCIMPTRDRPACVSRAIRCFLRQDYANRELILVDDGAEAVAELVPDDSRIHYVPVGRRLTLGEKRNLACELAQGELIAHWDDDDWAAPYRLRYQVAELTRHDAGLCGLRRALFFEPAAERAWRYEYAARERRRLLGSSLCYSRELWARRPFAALAVGEDTRFVRTHARHAIALADDGFFVGLIHDGNTSPKVTSASGWTARPVTEVAERLGADFAAYRAVPAA